LCCVAKDIVLRAGERRAALIIGGDVENQPGPLFRVAFNVLWKYEARLPVVQYQVEIEWHTHGIELIPLKKRQEPRHGLSI